MTHCITLLPENQSIEAAHGITSKFDCHFILKVDRDLMKKKGDLTGFGQWAMALIGYIGIIFVMFSGPRCLEIRQNKNYGNDPEYQKYVKTVPIPDVKREHYLSQL